MPIMEPAYGAGTDPLPYIAAAYALGAVAFVGFYVWSLVDRKRLRTLLAAVKLNKRT
jgi:hypothetical protein